MMQETQVQRIPLGYSIDKILSELANIRDYYSQFPFIRRAALQYGAPSTNNDLQGMYNRLVAFVRNQMVYVPDPVGFELVTAPDILLADIMSKGKAYGDCDDHVLLLNTMLASVGIETSFIAVNQNDPQGDYNHVISGVNLNGSWIEVDPCDKSGINATYDDKYVVY